MKKNPPKEPSTDMSVSASQIITVSIRGDRYALTQEEAQALYNELGKIVSPPEPKDKHTEPDPELLRRLKEMRDLNDGYDKRPSTPPWRKQGPAEPIWLWQPDTTPSYQIGDFPPFFHTTCGHHE